MLQRVDAFDVKPGRYQDALELISDTRPHIERLGGKNIRIARIVTGGPATGGLYGVIEFSSFNSYGNYRRRAAEDADLGSVAEKWAGPDSPVARLESSLQTLIGETGTWPATGTALITRAWDVQPGKLDDFLSLVEDVGPLVEQYYGGTRVFQWTVAGPNTGGIVSTVRFPDESTAMEYLHDAQSDSDVQDVIEKLSKSNSPARMTSWIVSQVLDN
jgi:hypothetical protein